MSAATSGGGGEGFPTETAVYRHRAIFHFIEAHGRAVPERTHGQRRLEALGTRRALGPRRRKASLLKCCPSRILASHVGGKICLRVSKPSDA